MFVSCSQSRVYVFRLSLICSDFTCRLLTGSKQQDFIRNAKSLIHTGQFDEAVGTFAALTDGDNFQTLLLKNI